MVTFGPPAPTLAPIPSAITGGAFTVAGAVTDAARTSTPALWVAIAALLVSGLAFAVPLIQNWRNLKHFVDGYTIPEPHPDEGEMRHLMISLIFANYSRLPIAITSIAFQSGEDAAFDLYPTALYMRRTVDYTKSPASEYAWMAISSGFPISLDGLAAVSVILHVECQSSECPPAKTDIPVLIQTTRYEFQRHLDLLETLHETESYFHEKRRSPDELRKAGKDAFR